MTEFAASKRALYFEATAGREADHLRDLSGLLAELSDDPVVAAQPLTSWPAVLAAIAREAREARLLVVLDEFQLVARESPDIGSLLNRFWRTEARDLPLFVVLSGSDVSFFEQEVMGYSATTYGRRTGSLRLQPFAPAEARLFLPGWSAADLVRAWGVFGGMPYYLDALDPDLDVAENIYRAVLQPGAMLREEPDFLLSMETRLRSVASYASMLRAMAAGQTRPGEIAQRARVEKTLAGNQLRTLVELGLVQRVYPVTVNPERSKTVRYRIADNFLRFWYRFVLPYSGRLHRVEQARRHLDELIVPQLDEFVSAPAFEEICQAWLAEQTQAAAVGWWWGSVREQRAYGPRDVEREADAVALDAGGRVVALGSCKWASGPLGFDELAKLRAIAGRIAPDQPPAYYLFARSGFTDSVSKEAATAADQVHLVDVATLYGAR